MILKMILINVLFKSFFAIEYDFFFLLLHSFFHCFMLNKRDNHNFKKRRGRTNLRINLKMHYTQVSFIWVKEGRGKLSMAKKSCIAC